MSAETATLTAFAGARERRRAAPGSEAELLEAARALLAGGPVECKFSTRVAAATLPGPKRKMVTMLRGLPRWLYTPPALAVQRGIYDDWRLLVEDCEGPDDQILALPKNRSLAADARDVAVECRPLDPTDARRTRILASVFAGPPDTAGRVAAVIRGELEHGILEAARRLVEKCSQV